MKKKKPNFQKKGLVLQPEEDDPLAGSIYSQIGPDGLKFLKDDIKVSKEGLIKMMDGNNNSHVQPLTRDDIEIKDDILGKGAAASVKKGVYKPLGIPVAIKTINALDKEKRHQLMNDIKLLLQNKIKGEKENFNCNFIVQLYGAFYEEGSVKVILELMDVGSLEDVIKHYRKRGVVKQPIISEEILARIAQQILNGLMYLHVVSRQIHRDIKPANILINSKGEVKLTDFGISKELEESNQFAHTFVGTVTYMSPERIEGKRYNHLSDIWSFGMVILEMATGSYPYPSYKSYIEMLQLIMNEPAPQIPENNQDFSNDFKDFINQCLKKNSKDRASAVSLLAHPWILKNCMKDIDLKLWLNDFAHKNEESSPSNNGTKIYDARQDDSSNKKSHKSEENPNLNMPKKAGGNYSRNKYQLEKIDEI